ELDAKTTPALKQKLELLLSQGITGIVIDCAGLTYIASAGIGAINATFKALQEKGGKLVLSGPLSQQVRDTMDLLYLTKRVPVYNSAAEGEQNV
ncbi:MAG: STAS domain-containing protein, partial [Leptospiraceae bacterium]|nr:STAS domain-containing protein [Leptospiraceae bacterium]